MSEESPESKPGPLVLIAGYCAGASVGIAALAFVFLHQITDLGMWAVAAMVAAPSMMGLGIGYFICKQKT